MFAKYISIHVHAVCFRVSGHLVILLQDYCVNEGKQCKDDVNSCHAVKAYIDVCDAKELLEKPLKLKGEYVLFYIKGFTVKGNMLQSEIHTNLETKFLKGSFVFFLVIK